MSAADAAAERLVRYVQRPQVQSVVRRYSDHVRSDEGIITLLGITALASANASGSLTRKEHRKRVRQLAKASGIPVADLKIIAAYQARLIRCAVAGTEQRAAAPGGLKSAGVQS